MTFERVYHPYWKWEEYHAGMWRKLPVEQERTFVETAIQFTGNADLYGEWMMKAVDSWPISCEHNLTEQAMNRQAWIGHAAACLAINAPEYITRRAWWMLTQEQRDAANLKADAAIAEWERRYTACRNSQLVLMF